MMLDSEWHHLVGVPAVAERVRRDPCEGYRELDEERPHHLQQHQQLTSSSGIRRLDGSSDIYVLIRRRLATTSSIALTYTVLTQSSRLTYEGLSSQLKSSVSSGYFNTQLQSIASGEGYNTLAQCTSSSATTVDETPTSSSSSNKDDSLSAGAIAGIVIGSVFGAVLLGLGLYYFLGPKGQPLLGSTLT